MTDEVFEYFAQRCEESGIRPVRGHHPNFETKEQVDKWIDMIGKLFSEAFDD